MTRRLFAAILFVSILVPISASAQSATSDHPFVVEGQARSIDVTSSLAQKFKAKYDWDITSDGEYTQLIEVTVSRRLLGG